MGPLRWGVPVGLSFCEGEWAPFLPCPRHGWASPESTPLRPTPMASLAEVAVLDFSSGQCPAWSPKGECSSACQMLPALDSSPISLSVLWGIRTCRGLEREGTGWCSHLHSACPSCESRRWRYLFLAGFIYCGLCQGARQQGVLVIQPWT